MWENVPNCTLLVICLFRVSYFAISLSQIDNQLWSNNTWSNNITRFFYFFYLFGYNLIEVFF